MNHEFIQKLTRIVQENLENEDFGPEQLAKAMGVSHSTLHRWLKQKKGKTISQFIRELRLEKARELIINEELNIAEIAYKVGFGSATYFNKCFHEYFECSPGEFRKKEAVRMPDDNFEPSKPKKKIKRTYLFLVAPVLVLFLLFLNERYDLLTSKNLIEKSIAILPANYLGDPDYQYQAEGTVEEIQNNLKKIKELRVLDQNSVEQYRSSNKTEKEIGEELKVGVLLKITFQKVGNDVLLFVKLIKASDGTLIFSQKYPATGEGIFDMQSKIAKSVASELKAEITPNEKQRIEKIPTTDLTAYDFYQRGQSELWKYNFTNDREAINRAERLFLHTIEYDSKFAEAYSSLAIIYWNKYYWKTFFSENFMDSALVLANKALSFDNQIAEAYFVKGNYYSEKGRRKDALQEYKKAIEIDPNYHQAYFKIALIYRFSDPIKLLENYHKAMDRNKGPDLPSLLRRAGYLYSDCGFKEIATQFQERALELDNDSAAYYCWMGIMELFFNNIPKANEFLLKSYNIDSTRISTVSQLAISYEFLRQFDESMKYYAKSIELKESMGVSSINEMHHLGNSMLQCGFPKEAEICFDKQLKMTNRIIDEAVRDNKDYYSALQYDLTGIYAIRGEKEKALEHLRILSHLKWHPLWIVTFIKIDPTFDNIKNEPEFEKIVTGIESNYQKGHSRVKSWLEEQGML